MRFRYLSDIHLERRVAPRLAPARGVPLFLAGDIGHVDSPAYEQFLGRAAETSAHVFLVTGNHEYDGARCEQERRAVDDRLESLVARIGNITFLNSRAVEYRGVWVAGATLWTPTTVRARHVTEARFLDETIARATGPLIVMTHHLPSYRLITAKYQNHPRLDRWASCSDYLLRAPVRKWVCGHSHVVQTVNVNGVWVLMNARFQ